MSTPNEQGPREGTHPLEQVTGERDVHPEEDATRSDDTPAVEDDDEDAGGEAGGTTR
ncbi:hypothetical protein ACPF8X_01915 [Streptomyces sp. G35A]